MNISIFSILTFVLVWLSQQGVDATTDVKHKKPHFGAKGDGTTDDTKVIVEYNMRALDTDRPTDLTKAKVLLILKETGYDLLLDPSFDH